MKVVIDTNVIVSGLLSPFGSTASILRLIIAGKIEVIVDERILQEYREVLKRPKFPFSAEEIEDFLSIFEKNVQHIIPIPYGEDLPDPGDIPFLEIGISGKADFLITGNIRHFPRKIYKQLRVVTPSEFLNIYLGREKRK